MENTGRKRDFKIFVMIICSPQLGISPESTLGGEVHDREMLKALANLGVRIEIILPLWKKHEIITNWNIHHLPIPFVYPSIIFNLLIIPYLFWIYHKTHFDVLRVHSPCYVGLGALFFKFFFPEVKLVAVYHHLEDTGFKKFLDRLTINKFDTVMTVSETTKKEIITKYKVSIVSIAVVPNGIDPKYILLGKDKYLTQKYHLSQKSVLLYFGQLIPRKNIKFLLDVLKTLPEDYVLLICGEGNQRQKYEQQAREIGLSKKVIFTGKISEADKVKFYNLADLFLYPSSKEGFGLSVLEAMACGKVVLANDIPPFKEIITSGKNGYLLPLVKSLWKEKIHTLCNNKANLRQIENSARNRTLDFTWQKSAEKFLAVIK